MAWLYWWPLEKLHHWRQLCRNDPNPYSMWSDGAKLLPCGFSLSRTKVNLAAVRSQSHNLHQNKPSPSWILDLHMEYCTTIPPIRDIYGAVLKVTQRLIDIKSPPVPLKFQFEDIIPDQGTSYTISWHGRSSPFIPSKALVSEHVDWVVTTGRRELDSTTDVPCLSSAGESSSN
jgi:hypothetical protein